MQELEVFPPLPRDGWHGHHNAQVFYLCRVVQVLPFQPNSEATERGFYAPEQIRAVPTMVIHDLLYEIALGRARV